MDHLAAAKAYYSLWLGARDAFARPGAEPLLVVSPERDRVQKGYPQPFALWALLRDGRAYVSCGARLLPWRGRLAALPAVPEEAAAILEDLSGIRPGLTRKYWFAGESPADDGGARPLVPEDGPAFLAFFRAMHPEVEDTGWVPEYFADIIREGLCCGVFRAGRLVSCTDLPDMPYLPGLVREIGISTLPAWRGRGLATAACAATVRRILAAGLSPLWSAGAENRASQRLAERLGFRPFGDCLTLALPAERRQAP